MALAGGAADKFGNYYEGHWIVKCLLEVVTTDAGYDYMHLEPPGENGFEFYRAKAHIQEFHQVKTGPHWTTTKFCKKGDSRSANKKSVWDYFIDKLSQDKVSECWFVANNGFTELSDILKKIGDSENYESFMKDFLKSGLKTKYRKLCTTGKLNDSELYNKLMRVQVRNPDIASLSENVESLIRNVVVPESPHEIFNAFDILYVFAISNSHKRLDASRVWRHLLDRGFTIRPEYNVLGITSQSQEQKVSESIKVELSSNIAVTANPEENEYSKQIKEIYSLILKEEDQLARKQIDNLHTENPQVLEAKLASSILYICTSISRIGLPPELPAYIWPIVPAYIKRDDLSMMSLHKAEILLSELALSNMQTDHKRKVETWRLILLTILPNRQSDIIANCQRILNEGLRNSIILTISELYEVKVDLNSGIQALEEQLGISNSGERDD